jgi:hypothetical protein
VPRAQCSVLPVPGAQCDVVRCESCALCVVRVVRCPLSVVRVRVAVGWLVVGGAGSPVRVRSRFGAGSYAMARGTCGTRHEAHEGAGSR